MMAIQKTLPILMAVIYCVLASVGTFTGGIWAIGGIGMAIIAALCVTGIDKHFPMPEKKQITLAILALITMAALNTVTINAHASWHELFNLITIFLPLALYSSPQVQARLFRDDTFKFLPIAMCVGAVALGTELALGGPLLKMVKGPDVLLTQYNRGLSYAVMLAFPVMAGLWRTRYRWLIVPFALVLLFPACLSESRSTKLALVLGLAAAGVVSVLPRKARWVFAALPVLALTWPFAVQWVFTQHYDALQKLPMSWHHRVEIWDYMSYRIMERPWLGWGLGASGDLPFAEPHGALYLYATSAAPHAHNAVIQLWVELGVPGIVLGVLFALYTLGRALRLNGALAPFAVGAWLVGMIFSLTAYNCWTDSLYATFALTGLAFATLNNSKALFFVTTLRNGVALDKPEDGEKIA